MLEAPLEAQAGVAIEVELHPGLADEIDAVTAAADPRHVFLRRSWYAAAGGEAQTLVARRPDGRPVAALPFVRNRLGPALHVASVPGGYWPFRSFPVALDAADEELACLLSHRKARSALGPAWRMGPVPADDPTVQRLADAAAAAGWTMLRRRLATSFRIDLAALGAAGNWPRGSTLRKNRFHEKHLASDGALEWRYLSGADWNRDTFDMLASIEARSWVASSKDAKFLAPHHRAFWEAAAKDPAIAAMMWAAVLLIGSRPVAFAFDLDTHPVKHGIANSYDEAFAKHSPGKVLNYRNLVGALERGFTLVDLNAGDAGYKRTIGAEAGPEFADLLFVRNRLLAFLLAPLWVRSGK